MFSSLKVRNFRIYWLGMLVSLMGTWIQLVAQSWLVFELTDSAFLLGLVGFLGAIPVFFLTLFGGVLADRHRKKNILLVTQSAFMFLAFILAILTQLKLITPWQIMLIALLNGIVMAFDAPARQSVVIELSGKAHLFNAIALNSVAFNSSRIIGPTIAGLLVASIGMSGCFYINGISFLAFIFALLSIEAGNHTLEKPGESVLKELKEGLIFIKDNPSVLAMVIIVGMVSLFGISYAILMPIFAQRILKAGVAGLGILMAFSGFGALIGALTLAFLGDFKRKGRLLIVSCLIFSISLIMFALSKTFFFSLFTLVFLGFSSVTAIALINTILQTSVPDRVRGRVMSVFMLTFAGFMPFGNLISGILAQAAGVAAAVAIGGVICTAFFVMIILLYPALRKL